MAIPTNYLPIITTSLNDDYKDIESFLDERILHLVGYLNKNKAKKIAIKKSSILQKRRIRLVEEALDDFKYCKALFEYTIKYPQDITVKNRFKDILKDIIIKVNSSISNSSDINGKLLNLYKQIENI